MGTVLRAEVRDALATWAGVGLTFIATTGSLLLSVMILETGLSAVDAGALPEDEALSLVFTGGLNLVLCTAVAVAVISSSTGLVLAARRPALAKLALAGATPGQLVRLVMGQLVAVTLLASVLGLLLAMTLLRPALDLAMKGRAAAAPEPSYALTSPILTIVLAAGLACLGGLRQSLVAARVSPVEAAREASTGAQQRVGWWRLALRWLVVLAGVGALAAMALAIPRLVESLGQESRSLVLQLAVASIPLTGVVLASAAPMIVGPLTRGWTALVPVRSAAWHLATRTVVAKSERMVRSVVPVMFSVGLLLGMMATAATFNASFRASGMGQVQLENIGPASFLSILGLPLIIASAGALGNLVMMSSARQGELAIAGLVGATPSQRAVVTVLEGVVLTVTGTLLAVVMAGVGVLVSVIALGELLPATAVEIPWVPALLAAMIVGLAAVLAALLPVLPSLRLPERAVAAQLGDG